MLLSIEVKNNHIYAVEAKKTKPNLKITKTHDFAFPESWVNEQGVVEIDELSKLIKKELLEQGFKAKNVNLCLNNSSMITRELLIPKTDPKRLPLLVRNEMISSLNLPHDYIMDFTVLEEVVRDSENYVRVLAVATPKSVLHTFVETLTNAKFKLKIVDAANNSFIKWAHHCHITPKDEQVIIADVGSSALRCYLFDHQKYVLSRNTKHSDLSDKNIDDVIETIIENLNKMVQYTYSRDNTREISRIVLTGYEAILSDLLEEIPSTISVPCVISSVEENLINLYSNTFVNAYGALIRK